MKMKHVPVKNRVIRVIGKLAYSGLKCRFSMMRIIPRIADGGNKDALPDILELFFDFCSEFDQPLERSFCIGDAPVCDRRITPDGFFVGNQTQLKSAYIKTDVERLIKIRIETKNGSIPFFSGLDVRDFINSRSKPEEFTFHR